jgi:hypothetical protein
LFRTLSAFEFHAETMQYHPEFPLQDCRQPALQAGPEFSRDCHCYGVETLRGSFLRCIENLRLLIVFCLGPFWYTQQLYFDSRFRLYISHGTDTIMTQYDTCRTEIPFGHFDVCIWVSHFLVQDASIEGTPHQCPSCGIFAEPLN